MKKLSVSFVFAVVFILASQVYAQSAVYFCPETGAWGYAYGYASESKAKSAAYDKCVEYGGTDPRCIVSTKSKGYGAIAIGYNDDGDPVIGAACGYDTQSEAEDAAWQACSDEGGDDIEIKKTWDDD
jgi:hypothetical protein